MALSRPDPRSAEVCRRQSQLARPPHVPDSLQKVAGLPQGSGPSALGIPCLTQRAASSPTGADLQFRAPGRRRCAVSAVDSRCLRTRASVGCLRVSRITPESVGAANRCGTLSAGVLARMAGYGRNFIQTRTLGVRFDTKFRTTLERKLSATQACTPHPLFARAWRYARSDPRSVRRSCSTHRRKMVPSGTDVEEHESHRHGAPRRLPPTSAQDPENSENSEV